MAFQYQQNDDHNEQTDKQPGLIIDISPALRRRLKQAAAKHDLPIQTYVEEALEKVVAEDEQKEERNPAEQENYGQQTLERLRYIREKIMEGRQGKPFSDSTEIIRQMREERSQHLSEL